MKSPGVRLLKMPSRLYIPGDKALTASYRLDTIQKFEKFLQRQSNLFGGKRIKIKALKTFCNEIGVPWQTFYGYYRAFEKGGWDALKPRWGWRKGKYKYESVIQKIKELYEPGKTCASIYAEIANAAKARNEEIPSYHTVWRGMNREGLVLRPLKSPVDASSSKRIRNQDESQAQGAKTAEKQKYIEPDWIRISNKRAFNLAIYKYSLILPLLDSSIPKDIKRQTIKDITSRTHRPFPGETFTISQAAVYSYLKAYKIYGLDGLLDKRSLARTRRYSSHLNAMIAIDLKDPIKSLSELHSAIESAPDLFPEKKTTALNFLDFCLKAANPNVSKYKRVNLGRELSEEEIRSLMQQANGTHRILRERAKAILMANSGCTMLDLVIEIGRSYQTIYGWIKQFKNKGVDFTKIKRDYKKTNPELKNRSSRIVKILHDSPKVHGFVRTAWRLADIADVYQRRYGMRLSTTSISRAIKDTGYTWKRARRVLISSDPQYRQKTKRVLSALQNLRQGEAFFFVDEAGPWAVKKYGGKSLTPKDEIKIFPQFQKTRGRVTFIGALNAVENKMIWLFTRSKDTSAVSALIKILFFKYRHLSKIILTWDCASWHKSRGVKKCLEIIKSLDGPEIEIIPLPKRAQFLNVIESVFSGTKKAIIHNSNYVSEYEMRVAINRYFSERNQYYKNNPKRIGHKIWDKQNFALDKFESGLHKHL